MLRFENVHKHYASRGVLQRIDLHLAAGETVLLAGPNGAGKTTLLRLAAGLARPSTGSITRLSERIGYLGHATTVYPGLSAFENLLFWQRLHKGDTKPEALTNALHHAGLGRRAHDKAGTFSRGMAQRLNIARLLLQKPDILLLDEPGTGLDTSATALLSQELQNARARKAAILWVSHDIVADKPYADRVVELIPERGGAILHKATLYATAAQNEPALCSPFPPEGAQC